MGATTTAPSARDRILDAAEALIHAQGFNATTLDAILTGAGASKGAFFHHFASKDALGTAVLERYAASDVALFDRLMADAETSSAHAGEQVLSFVRAFAAMADDIAAAQPGCLIASFVYERGPDSSGVDGIIAGAIDVWRVGILEKLELASAERPRLAEVDLPAMADMVFSAFEGGFIIARATGDPGHLRRQLERVVHYYELLLD